MVPTIYSGVQCGSSDGMDAMVDVRSRCKCLRHVDTASSVHLNVPTNASEDPGRKSGSSRGREGFEI